MQKYINICDLKEQSMKSKTDSAEESKDADSSW